MSGNKTPRRLLRSLSTVGCSFVCAVVVTQLACENGSQFPYRLNETFVNTSSGQVYRFDVNGDGVEDLVQFQPQMTDSVESQPNRINSYSSESNNTIEQVNLPVYGNLYMRRTPALSGRTTFLICYEKDLTAVIEEFDYKARSLHRTVISDLVDTNSNGQWEGSIFVMAELDVNGIGAADLIVAISATYDHQPRSLVALDGDTLSILWRRDLPLLLALDFSIVGKNPRTGEDELFHGNYACENGVAFDGMDDGRSYLIKLDRAGKLIWKCDLAGRYAYTIPVMFSDADTDSGYRIVCLVIDASQNRHDEFVVIDTETGRIDRRLRIPALKVFEPLSADLDNDGRPEIVCISREGRIVIFGEDLRERQVGGIPLPGASIISPPFDVDGDGDLEFAATHAREGAYGIAVYDHNLYTLGELVHDPALQAALLFSPRTRNRTDDILFAAYTTRIDRIKIEPNPVVPVLNLIPVLATVGVCALCASLAAAAALHQRYRREKSLLDSLMALPDRGPNIIIDNSLHLHRISPEALDLISRHFDSPATPALVNEQVRASALIHQLEALPGRQSVSGFLPPPRPGASPLPTSARPVVDDRGRRQGYILSLDHDMSRRETALARESVAMGQELVHKIKTLITVYGNDFYRLRSLLRQGQGHPEMAEIIDEMESVTKRITQIAKAFLTLSTLSAARREEVDINSLVTQTVAGFAGGHQGRIDFSFNLEKNLKPIAVDPAQISSVLTNLIENGIKAIADRGSITISSELFRRLGNEGHIDDYAVIIVQDTGCGIDEADLPRLLTFGYSGFADGTGIGLPIVKRIVELHDGEFLLAGEPGKGTIATVRLPYRIDS